MIRTALIAACLAGVAAPVALADPAPAAAKAQHKDLPPGVAEKASEAFARGRQLDEAGDLQGAIRAYEEAGQIYPHPNTTYNIADLYRRMKRYPEAIAAYEKYLQQEPDAPDHAAIEATLQSLRDVPGELDLIATTDREQAFINGEPVGVLPQTLSLKSGRYTVDVISPISYAWMTCEVRTNQKTHCEPRPAPRMDGNVVISGPPYLSGTKWRETGAFFMIKERFELRHGLYDLGQIAYKQCRAVQIEIPKGEDIVTYIYASFPDPHDRTSPKDCVPVTVKTRVVKL